MAGDCKSQGPDCIHQKEVAQFHSHYYQSQKLHISQNVKTDKSRANIVQEK